MRRLRPAKAALIGAALLAAATGALGAASRVQIEFDTRVPAEYVRLVEGRIIDDDSLDAWVDLPGNAEILRLGALRGELDREKLRENLWHSILGHSARRGQGLGSLALDPVSDLRKMLAELSGREEDLRRRVADQMESYLPAEAPEIRAVVRLHLGGTWDGRTRDGIYLNLTFLHNYAPPWFGAVEAILAHESTHLVHLQLDSLLEDAVTPEGLFAVALAQIHSEGIARHIEMGLLEGPYAPGTYAAFVARRYQDGLAGFPSSFARIEEIRNTCLRLKDASTCRQIIRSGLWRGGETYSIGHGMAQAIERALGRKTLGATLSGGAVRFFQLYEQATRMLPGLPSFSQGFDADLASAGSFLDERREAWRLRRESREAHARGDYAAAAAALRRLLEIDRSDPIAAYNLACALARQGNENGAMEWLERAVTLGYDDRAHMEADPDLNGLRGGKAYRRLLDRLGASGAGGSSAPNSSMK